MSALVLRVSYVDVLGLCMTTQIMPVKETVVLPAMKNRMYLLNSRDMYWCIIQAHSTTSLICFHLCPAHTHCLSRYLGPVK